MCVFFSAVNLQLFMLWMHKSTSCTMHLFKPITMVIAGYVVALLSEMCLTLQHLSGLDRSNPLPNSRGCNLEICAGTETVSAYSHKPHLLPHRSLFLPALRHIQHLRKCKILIHKKKPRVKVEPPSALQLTFSFHFWTNPPSGRWGADDVRPPSLISILIYLNTWLSRHHPPLSHRLCPTWGPICVLWPTPSPVPLSYPNLSVTDRTDLPCSNPPPRQ